MLTCTCTHKLRAMKSTWKSPLPNMKRIYFRSGLLWVLGPTDAKALSRPKSRLKRPSGTSPLLSKRQSGRLRRQYARPNASPHWIPRSVGTAPPRLQTSPPPLRGVRDEAHKNRPCQERMKSPNATRAGYSNHVDKDLYLYRKRTKHSASSPPGDHHRPLRVV